jgi:phosphoribosylaminoimidazole-succinocarboxamide synthase
MPGLELLARGKVRDNYTFADKLLIVASDRISAFDVLLGSGIPDKGRVLTQLSVFWFDFLREHIATHYLSAAVEDFPGETQPHKAQLEGRSMLVHRTEPFPVECVVRGYLAGSGWKDYQRTGAVCGIKLPTGLRESEKLAEPIFTPATKAETGHDENISFDRMAEIVGGNTAETLRSLSLAVYHRANDYASTRGLLLADTKFEFGVLESPPDEEKILLIDEVLTPDSSRFWGADVYEPGKPQPSYDKQFVRDYLEMSGWDKQPPGPVLPPDIVKATRERYREAYRLLTGQDLH